MSALRRAGVALRGFFRRSAADAELDEELRYHLERDIARRIAAGASPADALHAARRQFGNATLIAEESRESWQVAWLERLAQDVRYALRGFRRAPTFVATVVLTIGVGLGLLTAAFTIFDTYVLRPSPVRDPRGLYEVWFRDRAGHARAFSWNEYVAMRESNPALDEVFAYRWLNSRLEGQPIVMQGVSGNYFTALGVTPALGRVLLPSDVVAPGGDAVLVLSHTAWAGRFGGDSSIVGRTVRVNGRAMQVVGVARAGFDGLTGLPPDFWLPVTASVGLGDDTDLFGPRQPQLLGIVGRLRAGHTPEAARRALAAWGAQLTRQRPEAERAFSVRMLSRATPVTMGPLIAAIAIPIGVAFVLVLLIACANVANVMLARGMARQREIGVRVALGAARGRLVRQLLTESVLLAVPAAGVAFALSRFALDAGVWALFSSLPPGFVAWFRVLPMAPNGRVFAFLVLAALVAATAFGLVPALQATRSNVVEATRGDFDASFRPSRLRNALVGAQVTTAVLLLVCAGVLLRGAQRVGTLDPGSRTAGVLELEVMDRMRPQVLDELRRQPDVIGVAAAAHRPVDGGLFPAVPATGSPGSRTVVAHVNAVTPDFFELLDVRLRRGRAFTSGEAAGGAPVAVVSEETARRLWPRGDALGATLTMTVTDSTGAGVPRPVEVIGVSSDVVPGSMFSGTDVPVVFLPMTVEQSGVLLIRVRGDDDRALARIERALDARAPGAVTDLFTAGEGAAMHVYPFRFGHWLATVLGAVALLLTATGIYGVVSYTVAQRTKEIGIRLALGASRPRVVLLLARDVLRLAGGGLVLGTALSLGLSTLVASQLVAVDTFDVVAYLGAIGVVVAACAVSVVVPSRRLASVDPVVALRSE